MDPLSKMCDVDIKVWLEGDIYLTIDTTSACPQRLEYKLYDDIIVVDVISLEKRKTKINSFDKSKYKDYEIIDFR